MRRMPLGKWISCSISLHLYIGTDYYFLMCRSREPLQPPQPLLLIHWPLVGSTNCKNKSNWRKQAVDTNNIVMCWRLDILASVFKPDPLAFSGDFYPFLLIEIVSRKCCLQSNVRAENRLLEIVSLQATDGVGVAHMPCFIWRPTGIKPLSSSWCPHYKTGLSSGFCFEEMRVSLFSPWLIVQLDTLMVLCFLYSL